ncbi:MAG: Segregation and condensation protein [Bacteroidota bacterium]|jgi:segregation and condensation protein B
MRTLPFFLTLSRESQRSTLEALIFASDEPLTNKTMFKVLVLEDGLHSDTENEAPDNSDNSNTPEQSETQETPQPNAESASLPDAEEQASEGAADDAAAASAEAPKPLGKALKKKYPIEPSELAALVAELVDEINDTLTVSERPYRVVRIAGGYQFATTSEFGEVVSRLVKSRTRRRLSQAALEALSIIAYKQPISKPEIEAIRGINSNEVINSLVEKNLVTLAGRSDAPGKPLLYGTTDDFLRMFGLHSTKDLPKLRELDELFQTKAAELAGGLDISVKTTSGELLSKIQSMVDNEQKIIEHERLREEGRHEDEIPMPGTVITAQELQPDAQELQPDAHDAHDDSDHVDVDADADAESDSQEHGADDVQHQPDEEAE